MQKQKMVVVFPMECAGCRTCEVVCSLVHHGVCSPDLSNIRVVEWQDKGLTVPMTCLQCENPVCLDACPVKAIKKDEKTGAVLVNEDYCIGCKMCMLVCPFGGPRISRYSGKVVKCDLCGGDPQCVINCPTGAIKYMDVDELAMEKKKRSASTLVRDELGQITQIQQGGVSDGR